MVVLRTHIFDYRYCQGTLMDNVLRRLSHCPVLCSMWEMVWIFDDVALARLSPKRRLSLYTSRFTTGIESDHGHNVLHQAEDSGAVYEKGKVLLHAVAMEQRLLSLRILDRHFQVVAHQQFPKYKLTFT